MIVVDASAIVAILTREPEFEQLIAALERGDEAAVSPIAIFEAVLGLRRKRKCSVEEAEADLMDFLQAARVGLTAIEPRDAHGALEAFARYGKGTRHPAQLNLGDCFAYAQAKSTRAALLFKGEDFSRTDAESAA